MKKVVVGLVVVAVLSAVVFFSLRNGGGDDGVKVDVEQAELREIRRVVTASGVVDPRVKVNLSAHVVAKIESLYVAEGDAVEAGQPVLQLEEQAFVAARDDWRARLAQARSSVRQAEVEVADARLKQRRAESLAEQGVISEEDVEAARIATSRTEATLDQARESVIQAQANLTKAEDDLRKTTIYAPISGRVIDLNAEQGEVVVSGTMNNPASVIATLADLSEVLAEVDVDETEIVHVELGQEAELTVDALPDVQYKGHVVEVGSSGFSRADQPDVTFFKVKALFDEPDQALKPGMSVRASIVTAVRPDVVVVPIQTVVQRPPVDGDDDDDEIPVVFVMDAADGNAAAKKGGETSGKAVQRPVTTGISDATHVEITDGLAAGETVIVGPYRTLRDLEDGDAVRSENGKKKKDGAKEDDGGEDDGSEDDGGDEAAAA